MWSWEAVRSASPWPVISRRGGDRVRAANRGGRADLPSGVEVVGANVAEVADAKRVCEGAAVVYHCANPPYAKWPELHPPLMDAIIEGAAAAEARLVFSDNLYAYGPVNGPLKEDLPYLAQGPNGRTRARIAETLMRAHESRRIQATIGRGSDFFGPHAHLSTVGDRVFARAIAGKPAQVLGNPDAPHTVTHIDDFGRGLGHAGGARRGAGAGMARPQRRDGHDAPLRPDGIRGGRPVSSPSSSAPVGDRDGRPVRSDAACGQGAALSIRATMDGRQQQVRARLRLECHPPAGCRRRDGRVVP